MTKRSVLAILVAFAVMSGLSIGYYALSTLEGQTLPPPPDDDDGDGGFGYEVNYTRLDEFVRNLQSGGPPPDGIPPIETDNYWTVKEANGYLADSDIVFGFVYGDEVYAYPQRILVWHEIVNIRIDNEPISVTYCPLTGSCIAFRGTLVNNETTFWTSRKLVNSNLVMYYRETDSKWPQVLGQAINKDYRGYKLEKLQTVWTNWLRWKTQYPETLVLSTDTGFARNYERDPYGSYDDFGSYYYTGTPFFPVMHEDLHLGYKTVVYGLDINGSQHAVEKSHLYLEKVVNIEVGNASIVMFYVPELNTGRSFLRLFDGQELTFTQTTEGFVDDFYGVVWDNKGTSVLGTLDSIVNFDVMWFAWVAFFPNTGLTSNTY